MKRQTVVLAYMKQIKPNVSFIVRPQLCIDTR